jgi:hypothetical protein
MEASEPLPRTARSFVFLVTKSRIGTDEKDEITHDIAAEDAGAIR